MRTLAPITWLEAALRAFRCLPVRIGEKARVSAKTFVVGDSRQIELAVRPTENIEEAGRYSTVTAFAEATRSRDSDTTIS